MIYNYNINYVIREYNIIFIKKEREKNKNKKNIFE